MKDNRLKDAVGINSRAARYLILCVLASATLLSVKTVGAELILDVMSFNVRWDGLDEGRNAWINRRPVVIELLKTTAPDVCGLQEPSSAQTKDLDNGLVDYTYFMGEHERDETIPILFKTTRFRLLDAGSFWLVDKSEFSGGTRRCVWIRLEDKESEQGFYVYNCHLDHRDPASRLQSAQVMVETIAGRDYEYPFVICGDFNETEKGRAIRFLAGERAIEYSEKTFPRLMLIDSFRSLHAHSNEQGTGHGFIGVRNRSRIDYLWTSEDWDILQAAILYYNQAGFYPSDHFPVAARIKLRDS